jgi:hypothetical protein
MRECQPHNKQLQRTVERHRGDAARAPRGSARPLNCGVMRLVPRSALIEAFALVDDTGVMLLPWR